MNESGSVQLRQGKMQAGIPLRRPQDAHRLRKLPGLRLRIQMRFYFTLLKAPESCGTAIKENQGICL